MRRDLACTLILVSLASAVPAWAQEQETERELPRLGLSPAEPQVRSAPPAMPFGVPAASAQENVLDFHGYLLVPLRLGVHRRDDPGPGRSAMAIHNPPVTPEDFRRFEYTGVIPDPYGQFSFTYGNSSVAGTLIFAARDFTDAAAIYDPIDQLGVSDAFVSVNLSETFGALFEVKVGAVTGRYGAMGAFDAGRYATPLLFRTNHIGEMVTAGFHFGEMTLVLEQGIGGQLGRPTDNLVPAGWNDFADPNVGASFVNHMHAAAGFADLVQVGLHYATAWTQDDQARGGTLPDGRISVLGADARLTAGRAGHLYVGFGRTLATNAGTVSGIIEVLNARGGPELIAEYLGPASGGDGALSTFGAQYDLSLSRMVYGDRYQGKNPDVLISLFGIGTSVSSEDETESCAPDGSDCHRVYDGVLKLKGGAEVTYNMLSWLGVGSRVDHVRSNYDFNRQAYTAWTGRVLAHTGWLSRDEFALQYSNFTYGREVVVRAGYPPIPTPSLSPDKHVFSLSGTFWW